MTIGIHRDYGKPNMHQHIPKPKHQNCGSIHVWVCAEVNNDNGISLKTEIIDFPGKDV